jgi:hypothetical protein
MKKLSLFALLCTLALIALFPEESGRILQPSLPNFVAEAVSAEGDFVFKAPGSLAGIIPGDLAAGEKLLEQTCTACHSSRLVLKSRTLAGEVDSLVRTMMYKDHEQLSGQQHRQLTAYLESRFPRN